MWPTYSREKNPSKNLSEEKLYMRGKNQLKTSQVLLIITIRMTVLHLWDLQLYSLAGYFTEAHCWTRMKMIHHNCRTCHRVTWNPFLLKVWGHPWGIHVELPVELNNIFKKLVCLTVVAAVAVARENDTALKALAVSMQLMAPKTYKQTSTSQWIPVTATNQCVSAHTHQPHPHAHAQYQW